MLVVCCLLFAGVDVSRLLVFVVAVRCSLVVRSVCLLFAVWWLVSSAVCYVLRLFVVVCCCLRFVVRCVMCVLFVRCELFVVPCVLRLFAVCCWCSKCDMR